MSDETRSAIEALETAGRRVKVHDSVINVKLPAAAKKLIADLAEKQNKSDSAIVRDALGEYLTKRGYANH